MKKEFLAIWNLVAGEEEAALNRFHLRMAKGDFVELLGSEGAGKTALAAFLSGKARIRSGYVCVDGKRYQPGEYLNYGKIQYLGSVPSLAGSLTVAENIMLLTPNRKMRGLINRRDIETRASFLLSQFGMPLRANERAGNLSEGEKRVVELLRAAESEVPFLFVDSIFDTMGQSDMQMIGSCLQELKRRGVTILLLGRGFPLFSDLYDRVIVMRGGQAVRTFYRDNFDREEYVKWVFGITRAQAVRDGAIGEISGQWRAENANGRESIFSARNIRGIFLSQFSLTVTEGEIIGLYDMNNEKNREFIHLMIGDGRPSEGAMRLKGKAYHPGSVEEAFQLGVNYIPRTIRECAVVEQMSCGENILLGAMRKNSRFGLLKNDRVIRFLEKEYRKELGEEHSVSHLAGSLDAYSRIRIAFQRVLLARPTLLLLEDAISDMDVEMLRLQAEYFAKLIREGCAILISSPNLAVLRQVCDRIVVMNQLE